jgi:hypothetical protein
MGHASGIYLCHGASPILSEARQIMGLRDDLTTYSEHSSSIIDESSQMDKQNMKRKIIEPLSN